MPYFTTDPDFGILTEEGRQLVGLLVQEVVSIKGLQSRYDVFEGISELHGFHLSLENAFAFGLDMIGLALPLEKCLASGFFGRHQALFFEIGGGDDAFDEHRRRQWLQQIDTQLQTKLRNVDATVKAAQPTRVVSRM